MPSGNMAQSPDASFCCSPPKIPSAPGYGSCTGTAETGLGEAVGREGSGTLTLRSYKLSWTDTHTWSGAGGCGGRD